MKEIKLMKLTLKNFKGVKDFTLEVNGDDVKIYGENGAGKTTLYDAFLWLLFNKNSKNVSKFTVKTLTENGEEISGLENEVEAIFLVDGVELALKRVHYEDWTKARNSPEKTFKGNKNRYSINDVPTPEGQYKKEIENMIDEEIFRLLTSPTYFNEQLKWTDRRKTLLDIVGDLSDEDVISSNEKLKELTGILKGRKIEDHKLIIAAKKSKINEELKTIPVAIKENHNSLPEENTDVTSINNEVAILEKEISGHETQINNIKNGTAIVGKQQELQQVALDLESIKRDLEADSIEKANKVNAKIQEEQSNISILKRKKEDAEYQVKRNNEEFESTEKKLVPLREEYTVLESSEFTHEVECVCPTCEQDLPVEQVAAAKEKALTAFNLKKSQRLEEIQELGKAGAKKKDELLELNEKLSNTTSTTQSEIEVKQNAVAKLEAELEALREEVKDARQDSKYQAKLKEQTKLNEEIQLLKENATSAVGNIEKEVSELRIKLRECNARIAQQDAAIKARNRIAELETQQTKLAKEFEQVEKELFLIEEFTRTKVDLLDEKINSKFKLARFKLFHKQVNGELNDVCETTYKGVPYSSDLNDGAKIRVGLDIIQTLSEHYGFRVLTFIDNAESVTGVIETDSQLISLVASEKDKQLRIEKQADDMKEAI
ncbi:AAA family ATPase [Sporosarcina sp. FSL K6-3457]|uniref:AAA family ATPase n=1 Tax=Sporosarcina sp. FSL K6-3457 TaxID=2978204 RepID=UPI0030F707B5